MVSVLGINPVSLHYTAKNVYITNSLKPTKTLAFTILASSHWFLTSSKNIGSLHLGFVKLLCGKRHFVQRKKKPALQSKEIF